MLDFYEPPDPYVPAAEWAVVNVSGQRFHINMKHIKEYHKGRNLLICNGSQLMNPDISGALYTLRIQHKYTHTQCKDGAREVRVH